MQINFRDTHAERIKSDLLVIPIRENNLDESLIRALDRRVKGDLRARIQKTKFTGAEGNTLTYPTAGMLPAAQLFFIGLGGNVKIGPDTLRKVDGAAGNGEVAPDA